MTSTISTFEDKERFSTVHGKPLATIPIQPINVMNDYERKVVKVNLMDNDRGYICQLSLTIEDARLLALGLMDAVKRF